MCSYLPKKSLSASLLHLNRLPREVAESLEVIKPLEVFERHVDMALRDTV